jgi:hypothetical protein
MHPQVRVPDDRSVTRDTSTTAIEPTVSRTSIVPFAASFDLLISPQRESAGWKNYVGVRHLISCGRCRFVLRAPPRQVCILPIPNEVTYSYARLRLRSHGPRGFDIRAQCWCRV